MTGVITIINYLYLSPSVLLSLSWLSLSLSLFLSPLKFAFQDQAWFIKGALDVVLRHCSTTANGDKLTSTLQDDYTNVASQFGHQGLRGERLIYVVELLTVSV